MSTPSDESTRPSPSRAPSTAASIKSVAASVKSTDTTKSVPTAAVDKTPDESGKLRAFLSILKNFIGVTDIAAVRFSLPTQLLEPIPNLEYWNYLDRPETFVSIGDSEDELGRMLAVLRFWFTKDLKYVKGKPCKPYNSVLGEFFRCNWEIKDSASPILGKARKQSMIDASSTADKPVKLSYLTEQTSHHPPVSAFWIDCHEKGISARGYDQLSAKFTGTSIRVGPGSHNLGIFINLRNRNDEEYQLTHPLAHLGGLLRGSLTVTVADTCYVTCPKTGLKTILHYLEEGWLGKSQNKVVGVVYRYHAEKDNISKIKDVPEKDIVGRIDGCWKDKVFYNPANGKDKPSEPLLLIDLNPLMPEPKVIPQESDQLPNESRRFWKEVTASIVNKQYNQANTLKQEIEERQRQKAAARKDAGRDWRPRFFAGTVTPIGRPDLTEDGKKAIEGLQKDDFRLPENLETGA